MRPWGVFYYIVRFCSVNSTRVDTFDFSSQDLYKIIEMEKMRILAQDTYPEDTRMQDTRIPVSWDTRGYVSWIAASVLISWGYVSSRIRIWVYPGRIRSCAAIQDMYPKMQHTLYPDAAHKDTYPENVLQSRIRYIRILECSTPFFTCHLKNNKCYKTQTSHVYTTYKTIHCV